MASMVNMNNLLNGKDSRWLQLEVCREFQRNKCSRPDTECKFAHPPANVEVQNGRVTACYDSIKGRCNREKPPCKYFHPPQHLKDQLLINGRNHLALKNALMQQMGIGPGQQVIAGQVPAVATNPYLTGMPANTYSPYFAPGHLVPTLLGPDPSTVGSPLGHTVVPQAVQVAQQKIPRSDRLEMDMKSVGSFYYENFTFPGMGVPFKRPAADKSGIPVYQPGATTYQQLMQLQQPFVPVSCEYPSPSPSTATTTSNPQSSTANPVIINSNTTTTSQLFNNNNNFKMQNIKSSPYNMQQQTKYNSTEHLNTRNTPTPTNSNSNSNTTTNHSSASEICETNANILATNATDGNNLVASQAKPLSENLNIDEHKTDCNNTTQNDNNNNSNHNNNVNTSTNNTETNDIENNSNLNSNPDNNNNPNEDNNNNNINNNYQLVEDDNANETINSNGGMSGLAAATSPVHSTQSEPTSSSAFCGGGGQQQITHSTPNPYHNQYSTSNVFNQSSHYQNKSGSITSLSSSQSASSIHHQHHKLIATAASQQQHQNLLGTQFVPHSQQSQSQAVHVQYPIYSSPYVQLTNANAAAMYNLAQAGHHHHHHQQQQQQAAAMAVAISQSNLFNSNTNGVSYTQAMSGGQQPTDPATLAREVAQKNYANALKLAAASNMYSGKPLTAAFNYTGVALNKTLLPTTAQQSVKPKPTHMAPHINPNLHSHSHTMNAAQSAQAAQIAHFAAAANVARQIGSMNSTGASQTTAAQSQLLQNRHQMLLSNVQTAAANHQFLHRHQQKSNAGAAGIPMNGMQFGALPLTSLNGIPSLNNQLGWNAAAAAAAAAQMTNTIPQHHMAGLGSLQTIPQMTNVQQSAAAVVLNPYKKMKTS